MKVRNNMLKESKVAVRVLPIGLLSLMPAVLNSSTPVKDLPLNAQELTEVVAPIPTVEVSTIDFREAQASQQNYPLGWAFLRNSVIKEIVPTVASGNKANLVLSGAQNSKDIHKIYYIKTGTRDDNIHHRPSEIQGLIYHNLGEDKEFLGLKLLDYLYHDENNPNKLTGYMYREVKLYDEKVAQYLLDLTTGDTKWNDKTGITFEITNSPRVMVPEVY